MSWITDVENNYLPQINKVGIDVYARDLPLFTTLYDATKVIPMKGLTYKEALRYQGTGTGVHLVNGDEAMTFRRRNTTKMINVDATRIMFNCGPISGKETDLDSSVDQALKGVDVFASIEQMTQLFQQAKHKYMFMGLVPTEGSFKLADFLGMVTLNGDISTATSGVTGVTAGLLDFVAPASQSDTVLSLAKGLAYFWYNQFSDSTGYGGNSFKIVGDVARLCASLIKAMPGMDKKMRAYMDAASYSAALEYKKTPGMIVVQTSGDKVTDNAPLQSMTEHEFDLAPGVRAVYVADIDVSAYSTPAAQSGVTLLIPPVAFKRMDRRKGAWGKMEKVNTMQDVYTSTRIENFQHFIDNLQICGVVTGTAR